MTGNQETSISVAFFLIRCQIIEILALTKVLDFINGLVCRSVSVSDGKIHQLFVGRIGVDVM
jgi:hypothetical protein